MSFLEDTVLELHTDAELQEIFNFLIETAEQHSTATLTTPTYSPEMLPPPSVEMKQFSNYMDWIGTPIDPRRDVVNYGKNNFVSELIILQKYVTDDKTKPFLSASINPRKYRHRGRGSKKRNQQKHKVRRHTVQKKV